MKALLILFLALPASAQMPEQIADTAVMENQEFLLQEIRKAESVASGAYAALSATQTFTGLNTFQNGVTVGSITVQGDSNFSGATSTATFSGAVDIGWEKIAPAYTGSDSCQASCSAGKILMSGGCKQASTAVLQKSYPLDNDTWQCAFNGTTDCYAFAICAKVVPH